MRIVVTGGLGVNGSWVVRKLVERGHDVVVVENRPDTELVRDIESALEIEELDITDGPALEKVLRRHRTQRVVHMAAIIGAQDDLLRAVDVNVRGTAEVCEAAVAADVDRVVYTSSRAVYGDITGAAAHPTYEPVGETRPVAPVRMYDVCKVAGEGIGRNYVRSRNLPFVSLRFATIFGPGKLARHGQLSIYSTLIEDTLAGLPVRIAAGGDQRDDTIYVEDAAEAIVAATLHPGPAHDAYNISRGVGTTLGDFSSAVREVLPAADIEIGPGLDFFGMGVSYYAVLDNARARDDLGFSPRFGLADGVRAYVAAMEALGLAPVPSTKGSTAC
jgi:UDP-glucose 4-epimerase